MVLLYNIFGGVKMEFSSLQELKIRILPALKIKTREIYRNYQITITPDAIFYQLAKTKWQKATDLSLAEIVDDILKYSI